MIYRFTCDKCNKIVEVQASIIEGPPKNVICPDCGEKMHQQWCSNIIIPEYMKACNIDEMSDLKTRMQHSRPSGRQDRIFY